MATRDIRTSADHGACDVCGRTLLRGERAEPYLAGAARRSVCELCTARAAHEGWVREGAVPAFDAGEVPSDRRRSLLNRWRPHREGSTGSEADPTQPDDLDDQPWPDPRRAREAAREPRHVRAVPTNQDHKVSSAVDVFNSSEHRRTIAGVARSLGVPAVCVRPADARATVVNVVVAWELCWYRYEVDLSDEVPSVRVAGQGYELNELAAVEREVNASADDRGALVLGG